MGVGVGLRVLKGVGVRVGVLVGGEVMVNAGVLVWVGVKVGVMVAVSVRVGVAVIVGVSVTAGGLADWQPIAESKTSRQIRINRHLFGLRGMMIFLRFRLFRLGG